MNPRQRPAPDNFRELAVGKSINGIRVITGAHYSAIERWFREHGMTPVRGLSKPRTKMPADFDARAAEMSNLALSKHYGISRQTIRAMRKERGVPLPDDPPSRARTARPATKKPAVPAPDGQRDDSPHGLAADHLRMPRGGGWRVNRCTATGVADPKGDHFRVDHMVLDGDALLAMATRKGWQPAPRRAPA